MDNPSPTLSGPVIHSVEIYTSSTFVQGAMSGPFKRTTDLVNRRDRNYLIVQDASVTPLGQPANPRRLATPLMMGREHVHFVAAAPRPDPAEAAQSRDSEPSPREFLVRKDSVPCYILTDAFTIYGSCHVLHGASLDSLLESGDQFIPVTAATIYLNSMPGMPWQRDLLILNKQKIEIMHLAQEDSGASKPSGQQRKGTLKSLAQGDV